MIEILVHFFAISKTVIEFSVEVLMVIAALCYHVSVIAIKPRDNG